MFHYSHDYRIAESLNRYNNPTSPKKIKITITLGSCTERVVFSGGVATNQLDISGLIPLTITVLPTPYPVNDVGVIESMANQGHERIDV